MRIVVDASVAVKWLVPEEDSLVAMQLLDGSYELHAPRLLVSEVTNALWRAAIQGSMPRSEPSRSAARLVGRALHWTDDEAICSEALRIALELGHPTSDCMYVALARSIGAKVVTADKRFISAVASTTYGSSVLSLGDLRWLGAGGVIHLRTR